MTRKLINFDKEAKVHCGIPQGSILGPLFFILYVNDLPNHVSNKITISMYADDIVLYSVGKNIDERNSNLNNDLDNVAKWLVCDKLSLNVDKTELMILGSRPRLANISDNDVNVRINGSKLNRVTSCKHHV